MADYEKHTPQTDALDTLGMIHFRDEYRDAIHLAVDPVIASQELKVGERIGIIDGIAYPTGKVVEGIHIPYHGIVDPFLSKDVLVGETFWFVMKPREVRSLRHVWSHPDFEDE